MLSNANPHTKHKMVKRAMRLMGNHFEISVVSDDETWALQRIDSAVEEIKRIERLLTTFSESSETVLINRNAGLRPVEVSEETFQLIERSLRISKFTQGAFDITYGSIDKRLWNFDKEMKQLPDPAVARQLVRLINHHNVILEKKDHTVFLKEKGMRIGFGGIGKGYAAEKAKELMKKEGVVSGVVNASGDLTTWGRQPDGEPWRIGIVHPDAADLPFSYLDVTDMSVATSGNYEKYVIIDGKKYSHTINPRTGMPVEGIKSVTVISPNAELSDALATPVTIMGVEAGLYLVNQLRDIECIIIDDNNQLFTSKNILLT